MYSTSYRPLGRLFLGLLLCFFQQFASAQSLPNLGSAAENTLSQQQQASAGQLLVRYLYQNAMIMDDIWVNDYVQSILMRLNNHLDNPMAVKIFVLKDKSINAFASFDGVLAINLGLIQAAQSEDELAAVIAHELTHMQQKHLLRQVLQQQNSQASTLLAIAGALVLAKSNATAGVAVFQGALAQGIEKQLAYSRLQETEADQIGMRLLARAGYQTRAMLSFFSRLAQTTSSDATQGYLYTHPLPLNRMAALLEEASTQNFPLSQVAHEDILQLIQGKSLPQPQISNYESRYKEMYWAAQTADIHNWALLRQKFPQSLVVNSLSAELTQSQGNTQEAIEQLMQLLQYNPHSRWLVMDKLLFWAQTTPQLKPFEANLTSLYMYDRGFSQQACKRLAMASLQQTPFATLNSQLLMLQNTCRNLQVDGISP